MACGQINMGGAVSISTTPTPDDLTPAEFNALVYQPVPGVGTIGDTGVQQNLVSYSEWGRYTVCKGKGQATAQDFDIEFLDSPSVGLDLLQSYADPTNHNEYAVKIEWLNGSVEFHRALITGAVLPHGGNEDFKRRVYTFAPQQVPFRAGGTTAELIAFFDGGGAGFYSSVNPQYRTAYTTSTGNTLAANPGDPVGRVESLAGGLTLSQPSSPRRPVLGRYPEGGIRNRVLTTDTTGFVPGAPGDAPSNWRLVVSPGGSGVGREIIGTGVEDGIPYVDVRFFGTSTASASCQVGTLGGVNGQFVPSAAGDTWTNSFYVTLLTGSVAEFSQLSATIYGRNAGGGLEEGFTNAISITSGTLGNARKIGTSTLSDVDSAFANGLLTMDFDSGQTIDVTIRVGGFQFERGAIATPLQFVHGAPYDITEPGKREIWSIYSNGTQWMTFGTGNFGAATLFAGAGQEWVSAAGMLPTVAPADTAGRAIARLGGGTINLYQGYITPATNDQYNISLREGTPTNIGASTRDYLPHVTTARWDGSAANAWMDADPGIAVPVGVTTDGPGDITFLCQNQSSPASIFHGFAMPFLLDAVPSNPDMVTLRNALMAEAGV